MNTAETRNAGNNTALLVLFLIVGVSIGTVIVVYAIDNVGSVSDIVSLFDRTSSGDSAKDSVTIVEGTGNNNRILTDEERPIDGVASATGPRDVAALIDGGTSSPVPTSDFHGISEQTSLNRFIFAGETLAVSDTVVSSIGQAEAGGTSLTPTESGSGGGSGGMVYDESFLEKNPLLRMQIHSLYFLDERGGALAQVRADRQPDSISVTIRSFQNSDQPYVVIIETIDSSGYTVHISAKSGVIGSGGAAEIREPWFSKEPGDCEIKIMVWNSLEQPLPLGEALTREVQIK